MYLYQKEYRKKVRHIILSASIIVFLRALKGFGYLEFYSS